MCVCGVCIAYSQLPSAADVCLLSGVLCLHEWLRRVSLDGNPIDEEGLGYLCRALLKNGSIQSVSLNRCKYVFLFLRLTLPWPSCLLVLPTAVLVSYSMCS